MKVCSPVDRTGSPQCFALNQILQKLKYNTKHAHFDKRKTYQHNPKVSPFGIALIKKKKKANKVWRCWYHWPFGLAFQYQV